jgi:hypothetical protein
VLRASRAHLCTEPDERLCRSTTICSRHESGRRVWIPVAKRSEKKPRNGSQTAQEGCRYVHQACLWWMVLFPVHPLLAGKITRTGTVTRRDTCLQRRISLTPPPPTSALQITHSSPTHLHHRASKGTSNSAGVSGVGSNASTTGTLRCGSFVGSRFNLRYGGGARMLVSPPTALLPVDLSDGCQSQVIADCQSPYQHRPVPNIQHQTLTILSPALMTPRTNIQGIPSRAIGALSSSCWCCTSPSLFRWKPFRLEV